MGCAVGWSGGDQRGDRAGWGLMTCTSRIDQGVRAAHGGHGILPTGGQLISPVAVTKLPHWRRRVLPTWVVSRSAHPHGGRSRMAARSAARECVVGPDLQGVRSRHSRR